jgi:hypothetical protein
MPKPMQLAPLLASLALLTGCVNGAAIVTANCSVGNHVTVSKRDVLTEQTAQEIEGNNRSREAGGCSARTDAKKS